jgi:hypothetical protein
LIESKLHPPWLRAGIVARTALVERLLTASPGMVISVVAPPGYGKTTMLAQWAQAKGDRVGWVTIDPHHNDPSVLLAYLAVAGSATPMPPGTGMNPANRVAMVFTGSSSAMVRDARTPAGGADRRSAKIADAPINQSREAHHTAWPLLPPRGQHCGYSVVADYTRVSAVQVAGRAGDGRASEPQYPGVSTSPGLSAEEARWSLGAGWVVTIPYR